MKYEGKLKIEEGLELTNPSLEIVSVFVEGLFTDENGDKHSRFMKVDLKSTNLYAASASNEILKKFK